MHWQDVLQSAGWPTTALVIDFETYYDQGYGLQELSYPEYITDDRFEFTAVGWAELDRKTTHEHIHIGYADGPILVRDRIGYFLRAKYGENYEGATVVIQNVPFDASILKLLFGIRPPYMIDVKHLASHVESRASAKLTDIAKRLGLEAKGDTSRFKGLRYLDMDHALRCELAGYTRQDIKLESQALMKLLPQVSRPEVELQLMNHTHKLYLDSPLLFDTKFAEELVPEMQEELDERVKATGLTVDELSGNLSFVSALQQALPPGEIVPVKPHKRPGKKMEKLLGRPGVGPALAKTDDGAHALLTHRFEIVRNLMEARQAVKSWPNHIARILRLWRMANASGGKLPVPFKYYGGHTGRWSGSEGVNLQNLGSRSHALVNKIRNLITAPPGYTLAIVDLAQVEARFLAWIAGQLDLCQDFAEGRDIYSKFATTLFRSHVRKAKPSDPAALAKLYTTRRRFGKDAILGCGYGMGAAKFFQRMREDDDLRKLIDSGTYDSAFAERIIKTYRKTFDKIPAFWKEVEKKFKRAARIPGDSLVQSVGGLAFEGSGSSVKLHLPSGRTMRYPHCSLKRDGSGESIRWKYGHLWGGSLTENIVQAACRDILAEALLKLEDMGIPIVYHVHDELIACVPLPKAKWTLNTMIEVMSTPPVWAEGCPLACEGQLSRVYTK